MAQLVRRLLLPSETRGSNPDIGKIFIYQLYIKIENTKVKKKSTRRTTTQQGKQGGSLGCSTGSRYNLLLLGQLEFFS